MRRHRVRHWGAAIGAPAAIIVSAIAWFHASAPSPPTAIEWAAYGRDPEGTRFSPASRIARDNVSTLRVAWIFRTGDIVRDDMRGEARGRFEATPLFVAGTLYLATPLGTVFALEPRHGTERWHFDPRVDLGGDYGDFANRGVAAWRDGSRAPGAACARRIFVAPIDARLIALDAATGHPCADFGAHGQVDLATGLLNAPQYKGEYQVTSPPTVIGDVVVVGSAIADNHRTDAPSGIVRAYDARTGALRWSWDPIPRQPGAPGYDTWQGPQAHRTGAANAWSVMSADTARGLLFVPVGSASPDFFGGERLGQNLYANSVVALRAATGALVWHFQVVHHDLWDYDVPAQPVLITWRHGTDSTPAVVVATKMGHVFVLNRETGAPLLPVEERPVPATDVAGEQSWPTQPFPVRPAPLTPERLTADDAWGATPEERASCRARIAPLRSEGIFTPPSLRGTIIFPGNIGGSNWGGVAWDGTRGLLVGATNRVGHTVRLVPRGQKIGDAEWSATSEYGRQAGTPFGMVRDELLSARGIPCNPPPWGTLAAVDLTTGDKRWESPLGWLPQLQEFPGYRDWGSINLGGAMVTAGGLVFASGGLDGALHAFDIETGRELWNAPLPAGGNAMPMTYQTIDGRQYVVIAAGGHDRLHTPAGDYVVAFALPSDAEPESAPTRRAVAGRYDGDLRIGTRRYPGTWTLDQRGAWISGAFATERPRIEGDIAGTFTGDTLHFNARWKLPERNCGGTFSASATVENHGRLIEGALRLWAACGEHEEIGTFALRRR